MSWELTDDEKMMAEAVSRFSQDRLATALPSFVENHKFPEALVKEFGELGYLGAAYDETYGGAGLGVCGAAIVAETLARTEPSFAAIFLCNSAPCSVISVYGNDA